MLEKEYEEVYTHKLLPLLTTPKSFQLKEEINGWHLLTILDNLQHVLNT